MAAATGTEDEEDTVVLLGIPGKRMRQVESEPTETPKSFLAKTGHSAYESWIGGEAMDFEGNKVASYCGLCGKRMLNVCQIYAPFNGPRALAVMGCNSAKCSYDRSAWKVFRFTDTEGRSNQFSTVDPQPADDIAEDIDEGETQVENAAVTNESTSSEKAGSQTPEVPEFLGLFSAALNVGATQSTKGSSKKGNKKSKPDAKKKTSPLTSLLQCYFLNIVEDPFDQDHSSLDHSDKHIEELYHKYLNEAKTGEEDEDMDFLPETIHARESMRHHARDEEEYEDADEDNESTTSGKVQQMRFRYRQQVSKEPLQVIRYHWDGEPLWPYSVPRTLPIPKCSCGKQRKFEFQVLPSALHYLNPESVAESHPRSNTASENGTSGDPLGAMDWNSLCIYSCCDSCTKSNEESVLVV